MDAIPKEQHAWVVTRQGLPIKALSFKTDWPVPKKLEEKEVLVKIQAAALNPAGWKLMVAVPNFLFKRPHVPELYFSGVIVNSNGTECVDGDAVYGWVPADLQWKNRQGALAQYVRVPHNALVKRPPNITPTEAAGITVAALTSHQGLFHIAKLEADQTIFINGGNSSLGSYAIQLAKARGAKVIATASGKNEDLVRGLGANEFIDYTKKPLYDQLLQNPPTTKYHVIFDAVGIIDPSLFTHSEKHLAPNGIFVSSGPMPTKVSFSEAWSLVKTLFALFTLTMFGGINRRYSVVFTKNSASDMREIQQLIADGNVKPVVDSVYELRDALAAYEKIMTSRARGKVIVKVDPSVDWVVLRFRNIIMLAFLTVGSTRFDSLVAAAFTESVLSSFRRKGYTHLVVQCGNSAFELSVTIQNGQTQRLERAGVEIEFYKFRPSLQEEYEKADLVVSHAGSGTILEVRRMGKPMIVVPNPTLLDNHQEELASALQEMNYLKATTVDELAKAIDDFDASNVKPFPAFDGSRFARILDEEMGFI